LTIHLVAVALLFWSCVFLIYFTAAKTTPLAFFLGRYEPLPADLGSWKSGGVDSAGVIREERCLLPGDDANASHLLWQVRYRDAGTRAIVRVDPERRVPRRRRGRGGAS
jgi:hypothetical protein